jgi:hypothetical protein
MSKAIINLPRGPAGEFVDLSEAQKASLEAAYGDKLSPELWREIKKITNELTVEGPPSANAASYDKTLEKLIGLGGSLIVTQLAEPNVGPVLGALGRPRRRRRNASSLSTLMPRSKRSPT